MSHAAELSIVVVATNLPQVTSCVQSIRANAALERAEIILVSTLDCSSLLQAYPGVQVVSGEVSWSLPKMRAAGLRAASRPLAAVFSEDYRVMDGWSAAVPLPTEHPDVLVGEILPPKSGAFARAAYLWEYLHVAHPATPGQLNRAQASGSPAGAVVYNTGALDVETLATARSEMEYHQKLFDAGIRFFREPQMRWQYSPPAAFLAERLRRSRDWARSRSDSMSLPARLLAALSRCALPPLLVIRFSARLAVRPSYWLSGLAALPFIPSFVAAETLGEMQGYLRRTV